MERVTLGKEYPVALLAKLHQQYQSQEDFYGSVTLTTKEGQELRAHGCILAACSPTLCSYQVAWRNNADISVEQFTTSSVQTLLDILYVGSLPVIPSIDEIKDCKLVATALDLSLVATICDQYLKDVYKISDTSIDCGVQKNNLILGKQEVLPTFSPRSETQNDQQDHDSEKQLAASSEIKNIQTKGPGSHSIEKHLSHAIPPKGGSTKCHQEKGKLRDKDVSDEDVDDDNLNSCTYQDAVQQRNTSIMEGRRRRKRKCRKRRLEQDYHYDMDEVSSEEKKSVFETFSVIAAKLLSYKSQDATDPTGEFTSVKEYEESVKSLEFETCEDTSRLDTSVKDTFHEIVTALQAKKTEGLEEKDIKTDLAEPDKQYQEWKECPYCSKFKGKKKGRFEFHMQYCKTQLRCDLCYKPFLNEFDLNKHRCGKMERFVCDICGKVMADKPTLKLHKNIHMGIKTKVCQHCGKAFSRACHLKAHILHVHSKERPYQCEHCSAAFALKYELNRHMQRHTEEPNFLCSNCGLKFYEKLRLTLHSRVCGTEAVAPETPVSIPFADSQALVLAGKSTDGVEQPVSMEITTAVDNILHAANSLKLDQNTKFQLAVPERGMLTSMGDTVTELDPAQVVVFTQAGATEVQLYQYTIINQ